MGARKSTFTESRKLIKRVRKQGFECVETSKGFRVLSKDGEEQVTVHMTMNQYGMKDVTARLRKIGVQV